TKTYPDNTERSERRAKARGDVPLYLLQTNALKDRVAAALEREEPGANYIHFPDWLGPWFYEELTYEERGADGKWKKPGRGNNEALDLMCYAHALAILRGYERINWEKPPGWARLPEKDAAKTTQPVEVRQQEQHEGGEKAVKARKKKILPAWGGGSGGGWL
ncbi:phage terminase large subunit family protein, partial [Salmonella enterica]|nr:phage terminase large subunit family protein [Salmonella enterica]